MVKNNLELVISAEEIYRQIPKVTIEKTIAKEPDTINVHEGNECLKMNNHNKWDHLRFIYWALYAESLIGGLVW